MSRPYVIWALIGMVGYSLTTLFMKLAIRDGRFSSFLVLAIATEMTATTAVIVLLMRGDLRAMSLQDFWSTSGAWSLACGVCMAVAVAALFRGLALGPASVVVPIYCMFSAGGAVLGLMFLHEPVTARRLIGIALAGLSVFLIAGNAPR